MPGRRARLALAACLVTAAIMPGVPAAVAAAARPAPRRLAPAAPVADGALAPAAVRARTGWPRWPPVPA